MTPGPLDLAELDHDYVAVIQLLTQPPGVIHQVTLREEMVRTLTNGEGIIRLGQTQGDEVNGWQYPKNVIVIAVLGRAVREKDSWLCLPIIEEARAA